MNSEHPSDLLPERAWGAMSPLSIHSPVVVRNPDWYLFESYIVLRAGPDCSLTETAPLPRASPDLGAATSLCYTAAHSRFRLGKKGPHKAQGP